VSREGRGDGGGRDDAAALAPAARAGGTITVRGQATTEGELLRAPASGAPCVHWRLRIFETVAAGMELVHEVTSPGPLEVTWRRGADRGPAPHAGADGEPAVVRVSLEGARLEAQPALFRPGSAGAEAVARQFGLVGAVRVEEVAIKPGERLEAEGVLLDPAAGDARPFRANQSPAELVDATVRLETGVALRPAILPWALGTAAALLGAAGAATAVAKLGHLWKMRLDVPPPPAEIGPAKFPRPRWP
jgi:hypothetical protein